MGRHLKDHTGERLGKLTLISFNRRDKEKNTTIWNAICECGTKLEITYLPTKSKVCCGNKACKETINNEGPPRREWLTRYYKQYAKGAIERKYTFELSKEEFEQLIFSNCYYCNRKPYKIPQKIVSGLNPVPVVGIDRINNEIGYILSNCVPCCSECNIAKGTMTRDQFLWMCRLVALNTNLDLVIQGE